MRAIDHERQVASLSVGKLRQTFVNNVNGLAKNEHAGHALFHLNQLMDSLDKKREELIASCETEGHDLAPGEAGYTSICMVCGKTFETEDGDGE